MAVRMAHIQLPEDLGIEDAILPGDPARVDRVAALLEQPEELMFNREYKSVRGLWKGRPVLIISTGMGGPSTAIAVEELARTGVRQMIRIGSCGALTPTLDLGDLVLVCGAVRDDGTSAGYLPAEYPAVPDLDLLNACRTAARRQQAPYQIGIARSHDCMYRDDNPALYETWSRRGVIASDMETATMLVVGRLRGVRWAPPCRTEAIPSRPRRPPAACTASSPSSRRPPSPWRPAPFSLRSKSCASPTGPARRCSMKSA